MTAFVAKNTERRHVNQWRGLSLLFLLAAIDEMAQLHDKIPSSSHGDGASSHWIVLYLGVLAVVGLAYVRFFFVELPKRVR
ncbi:MAG: hypothetical protein EXS36_05395 [Pedosphaera sp.]|nr:hypothetical protein [Pedosphaera sp.]